MEEPHLTRRCRIASSRQIRVAPADALKFLTYMHREPTDYVKVSHDFYKGKSIDEIFQRARSNWKK